MKKNALSMSSSGDPVSSGLITEDRNNAGTSLSTEVLSLQGEGTVKGDVKTCQEAVRGGRVQRPRERGRGSSGECVSAENWRAGAGV